MARYDGLDEGELCRLTGAPRAALFANTGSVMDAAHELAASGGPTGAIALADEQSAGRGRSGRSWQSPPGAGVWLAVVLRPAAAPAGGALAIRTGLAARQALSQAAPALRAGLKWPNDIVTRGRKLGGILCEARWANGRLSWISVGIGLNVLGPVPDAVRDAAIAVVEVDATVTRLGVLEALVPLVTALAECPAELSPRERSAFLDALWMPEGEPPVVGLEADGALLVRRADGSLDRRTDAA